MGVCGKFEILLDFSQNIQYKTPTILGTTLTLAYAPEMGASDTADKAVAAWKENSK